MDSRIKLSPRLLSLISDYEQLVDQGKNVYLDDKEYHKIISYYEDELELDRALDTIEKAINQYAYRSDFLNLKTRMLIKKGLLEDALVTIEGAELVAPHDVELQLLKTNIFILQKRYDESINLLEELKTYCNKSDLQDVYVTEAFFYESIQEHDQMFESLKQALIINPNNDEALRLMTDSVDHSKNYEESILLHKIIVDNHPYNYLAWYNLGSAYGCVGEYQKAIDALEYSFIINPEFEQGYIDCAEYCCELKQHEVALEIYTEALEVFGPEFDMLINTAQCQYSLGLIDQAKRSLFEAIEIDSYSDEAFFLLAKCYIKNQDYHSAVKVLRKAISIENTVEEYYHLLGMAYHNLGIMDKASFYYKRAAEKGFEISSYWEDYILFLIDQKDYDKAHKMALKADNFTFSYKLMYINACTYILNDEIEKGLKLLEEALQDAFNDHTVIFSLPKEISENKDILSIITYYKNNI
jgi:tetratricopeptide (TPR) repeat protein